MGAPKHLQLYHCYSLLEASLLEDKPDEMIGLDEEGDPLTYRTAMAGPFAKIWSCKLSEEYLRLTDTGTISWDGYRTKPHHKKATYLSIQIKEKRMADGTIKRRVRCTVGGDRVTIIGEVSSGTASMDVLKILLNAVASEDAFWSSIDITDYYLGSPMDEADYQWMYIAVKDIPFDIRQKHDVEIRNGKACVCIQKGMYGLPNAGLLAQDQLIARLAEDGYHETDTECLFKHDTRGTLFMLVVDDFGIKTKNIDDLNHLIATLSKHYKITIDPTGSKYLGMDIEHDRTNRLVSISMPRYVPNALKRFNIDINSHPPAHSPLVYHPVKYGQQYEHIDESPPVTDPKRIKRIQQIIGVFLYYARAVDETMLCALNKMASRQANPTGDLEKDIERFLHYAATHPSAKIVYRASAMVLIGHSDASYLSETGSRSRCGSFWWLGEGPESHNHGIGSTSQIIPNVTSSIGEAEYAGVFIMAQRGCILQNILASIGHPQTGTIIVTDNTTADNAANKRSKIKKLQTTAMRHHWIRDRVADGQFRVIWEAGYLNKADFFTKPLPVKDHELIRTAYAFESELLSLPLPPKPQNKKSKTSC